MGGIAKHHYEIKHLKDFIKLQVVGGIMEVTDILPILVPGIIIQVLIEGYYIKDCWDNTQLSIQRKIIYIFSIAIFNIPAAAIYLFFTRKKTSDNIEFKNIEIDSNIKQGIFVLLLSTFEIMTLRIISTNINNKYYPFIIGLLAVCFISMIINGLLVKRKNTLLYFLLPALQIILVIPVEYLDSTNGMQFIVLAVVAGIINQLPLLYAKIYSIITFILYFTVNIIKPLVRYGTLNSDEIISNLYVNVLVYLLVFATFYMLKKQLLANKQLENVLRTLREQSLQLEEMGAITERNRITGEIHDMVGHTLTTAVIAIEAGERLIDKDEKAALEKFSLAKEQVKLGLNDIRSSVKAIQTDGDKAFIPKLNRLLNDIRKNTDLIITDIVELKTELLPIQQNVLLRVIKECTTNSLNHGKSTEADLLLQEYKDSVRMTFSDNGEGTDKVVFGFGLNNMEKLVQSIGGTLTADNVKGEGFTVNISIPTGIKKEGELI
ncbi:MAG: conserved rane protein of unknown function [Clostridia bacterium]|nr:conserved rane protein of unknown function [Clostridia bacterium]